MNKSPNLREYKKFVDLGLSESLLRGLYYSGYHNPSYIQRVGIAPILEGKDVLIQAQSGSGKTATFAISVIQKIEDSLDNVQAVVIAPTRELATQIHSVFNNLSNDMNIKSFAAYGGRSDLMMNFNKLKKLPHVLVGTPGRILDLLRKGTIDLKKVKTFVVDETDEMINKGLKDQFLNIYKLLSNGREDNPLQMVVASATMNKTCLEFIETLTNDPIKILVPKDEVNISNILQTYIDVGGDEWKFEVLMDIFNSISVPQTIVFAASRDKVLWLSKKLKKQGFPIASVHGDVSQDERESIMVKFRSGQIRHLITTDIWARGIDVYTIALVINYDMPSTMATYVHRIGRSGRFGRKGVAISLLCEKSEKEMLTAMAKEFKIIIRPAPSPLENLVDFLRNIEKTANDQMKKSVTDPETQIMTRKKKKRKLNNQEKSGENGKNKKLKK